MFFFLCLCISVGDAPVVYARWRIEKEGEAAVAVVDRMVVLKSHRGRGYSTHSLDFLLQVINSLLPCPSPIPSHSMSHHH